MICLSAPILGAFCYGFKKFQLRKEVSMVQRLKTTLLSGVSNIYGVLITMFTLLVICMCLVWHLVWVEKNKEKAVETDQEYGGVSKETMVGLFLLLTFFHVIPFRSYALRSTFIFIKFS